jgi:hypothetical protein
MKAEAMGSVNENEEEAEEAEAKERVNGRACVFFPIYLLRVPQSYA